MEEESEEVRWEACKWDVMVKQVFNMITTSLPPDITLVTEDGNSLEAHSIVLKASSPTFRSILQKTNAVGKSTKAANTTIYMPGFFHEQLAMVVEFIYMGKTMVAPTLHHELLATFKSLGILSSSSYKQAEKITSIEPEKEGRKDPMVGENNETEETEDGEIVEEDLMGFTNLDESEKSFGEKFFIGGHFEGGRKDEMVDKCDDSATPSNETEDGEIVKGKRCKEDLTSESDEAENEKSFGQNFIDRQFERCQLRPTETNCKTAEEPEILSNVENLTHTIKGKDNQTEITKENEDEENWVNLKSGNEFNPDSNGSDFVTAKQEQDEDIGPVMVEAVVEDMGNDDDEEVGSMEENFGEIEEALIKLRALSQETGEKVVNSGDFNLINSDAIHDKIPIAKKKKKVHKENKKRKEKKKKIVKSDGSKVVGIDGRVESRGKVREVTCEICGKHFKLLPFRKDNKYNKHMKRHEIKDHNCGCGITFDSFNQKLRHMRVIHQGYFNCILCPQKNQNSSFATENFLREHERMKHPEKKELPELPYKETFTCKISKCTKTFITKRKMMYHANSNHGEEGPFVCDHCGKKLRSKVSLRQHEKKVHNPKPCPICYKVVKNLRCHILTNHTDDSILKLKCENCGKGFRDRAILKSHKMNVHIKTRPFRCRYSCQNDIGYNDLSNRNSHEKKKHGGLFIKVVHSSLNVKIVEKDL